MLATKHLALTIDNYKTSIVSTIRNAVESITTVTIVKLTHRIKQNESNGLKAPRMLSSYIINILLRRYREISLV